MVCTHATLHIIIAEAMQNGNTELVMDRQILKDLLQSWKLDPFRYFRASLKRFPQLAIGGVSQEDRGPTGLLGRLEAGSMGGLDIPEKKPEKTALLPRRTRSVQPGLVGPFEIPENQTSD